MFAACKAWIEGNLQPSQRAGVTDSCKLEKIKTPVGEDTILRNRRTSSYQSLVKAVVRNPSFIHESFMFVVSSNTLILLFNIVFSIEQNSISSKGVHKGQIRSIYLKYLKIVEKTLSVAPPCCSGNLSFLLIPQLIFLKLLLQYSH